MIDTLSTEQKTFNQFMAALTSDGQQLYVGSILRYAATRYGASTALMCEHNSLSYSALYRRAIAFSLVLRAKGVKPGDKVLLFFENSIEFYVGYYAILQVGAVVTPLNVYLHDKELHHIMHDAQPVLMVISSALKERYDGTLPVTLLTEHDMPETASEAEYNAFHVIERDRDSLAVLLYTSGTTGMPKGVMLSSRAVVTNSIQSLCRFPTIVEHERIFGVLPLFHSFAQNICVWTAFISGCTVIVVPRIERKLILEHMRYKPTVFLGVPALYALLCLLRTVPVDEVKFFVCGGDVLPDRIRAAFALIYGRRIVVGYGLTEAAPVVSAIVDDQAFPVGAIGKPMVGITAVIQDEQGKPVAPGIIGELVIKGDNLMLGYYNSPEMTATVLKDGWLYTGDLGYMAEDGLLILTGRLKDLIIHKGFNIYPQEIENIIAGYANVMRVGVIGRKDEQTGEVPIAYVQLKQEEQDIEKKLHELCRQNMATYKIPREFICSTEPLPTTATGKVDKKQLRLHTK